MKAVCVALAMVCLQTVAQAEVRHFRFVGTVTQSLPMAPIGAKVVGRFSYKPHAEPDLTLGDPAGDGYSVQAYPISRKMTMRVNGHRLVSPSFRVIVTNNFGGNVEDSITVNAAPMTLDGTQFAEGVFGLVLASGPGKTDVFKNTSLPKRFAVRRFDGMNYGFVQVHGGSDGTLLNFSIDSVTEIGDREDD
jgi:hypothetical protein